MKSYRSERAAFTDPDTGAAVVRYTGWRGNSNHLYFTNNSFYDGGRRIVFMSDRENAQNLYSLDLESGEIEQLTELPQPPYPMGYGLHESFVDPVRDACCFFVDRTMMRLDLRTRAMQAIYEMPPSFRHHILSVSADGRYVYTSIFAEVPGARTLQEISVAHPRSRIVQIDADGGGARTIWEEDAFLAHVNASPTDPDLLTFCHEGAWDRVDHRLWLLDLRVGTPRKLHPCGEGEVIGHEYWYADGRRIGYHGHLRGAFQLGVTDWDGAHDRAWTFPFRTGHIYSLDERLVVGDGSREGRYIRLWALEADGYGPPRALCAHNCSFKTQEAHVHPRFTPDGRAVLYTSDETGYNQIYLARVPESLSDLPPLSALSPI